VTGGLSHAASLLEVLEGRWTCEVPNRSVVVTLEPDHRQCLTVFHPRAANEDSGPRSAQGPQACSCAVISGCRSNAAGSVTISSTQTCSSPMASLHPASWGSVSRKWASADGSVPGSRRSRPARCNAQRQDPTCPRPPPVVRHNLSEPSAMAAILQAPSLVNQPPLGVVAAWTGT